MGTADDKSCLGPKTVSAVDCMASGNSFCLHFCLFCKEENSEFASHLPHWNSEVSWICTKCWDYKKVLLKSLSLLVERSTGYRAQRVHQPSSENGQLSRPNPCCIFAFLNTSQVAKRNPNLIYTEFFMRLWVLKLDFGGFQVASCGSFLSSVTKGFALGRGYWLSRGGTSCLLICSKASQGPTFPELRMSTPLWAGQCLWLH